MDLPPVYKYVQGNITNENTKKKLFTELWRAKPNHFQFITEGLRQILGTRK